MPPESSLLPILKRYFEKDPVEAAHFLEAMDEDEALGVLIALPPLMAAEVVRHLPSTHQAKLLQGLSPECFKNIVETVDAQQGASLFLFFPPEMRALFLEMLSASKKKAIQELLAYPEDSAARIMSTDFLAFHSDLKVKDAIEKIRALAQKSTPVSYLYVVNKDNRLVGVMNMRDMLLADPEIQLEAVMRRGLFTVDSFMDREKVIDELSNRRYLAAPVVDSENHLLGVVRAEQLLDEAQEEATEDLQKMFGVTGDERPFSPLKFSIRTRLPWLYINLVTAFAAGAVVAVFEDIIARITVLAVCLPVIAGQGGNAGAQSLAVVMRGIVMREIPAGKVKNLIMKESFLGVINGFAIGIVTAAVAWIWQGNPMFGLVVGLGMLANLVIAGFSGAAIPLTMKAVGLDPAQCSNIILTTVTDVMGFFSFLGLAVIFEPYLT